MLKHKERNPYDELWISLVKRVHRTKRGFSKLNADEKVFYALNLFEGSVYNGGMYGFFSNTSGDLYKEILEILREVNALQASDLLIKAKKILFGEVLPPKDHGKRNDLMKQYPVDENSPEPEWIEELNKIDREFYKISDDLIDFMIRYADEKGLVRKYQYTRTQRIINFFTAFFRGKNPNL